MVVYSPEVALIARSGRRATINAMRPIDHMDDRVLIAAARRGDTPAFEKLISAYTKKIYNYALRLTNDATLAEDLCQETFIKAFLGIQSFKEKAAFSTWIYRIAYNTFLDSARKAVPGSGKYDDALDDHGADVQEISSQRFCDQLRQTENADWLTKGLARLPEPFRSVVILRDIQDLSYEEIAAMTDTSTGTVKSRLSRGREHLRHILISIDPDHQQ